MFATTSIESVDRLTLPVSVTLVAACNIRMFYVAERSGEEESWLLVYCVDIDKCDTVKLTSDTVTFNFRCLIYY